MNHKGIDFNILLIFGNFALLILTLYTYLLNGSNKYVDHYSIFLFAILAIENILILWYELKNRDPFLITLQLTTLIFFLGRIPTLIIFEENTILSYLTVTPSNINYSLIFIICSNFMIFLGLIFADAKKPNILDTRIKDLVVQPIILFILYIFVLIISFPETLFKIPIPSLITGYLQNFVFNYQSYLLIIIVFLVLYSKKLSYENYMFGAVILFYIMIHGFSGGRGTGFEHTFSFLFFTILSFNRVIYFRLKHIVILLVLIPLVYFSISFGYFNRLNNIHSQQKTGFDSYVSKYKDYKNSPFYSNTSVILPFIFSRIGSFDHTIRLISHGEDYLNTVNPLYNFQSVIDNVFTPGMDFFDKPYANHTLKFIDNGIDEPGMYLANQKGYHSTTLTIYGETYVWFKSLGLIGILGSLLALFIFGYVFKSAYYSINNSNPFLMQLYQVAIIYLFYVRINTFGFDWDIRLFLRILLPIMIFSYFFVKDKEVVPSNG